jgi:aryl-alcohol dehydrogenase-like predicted oxidoreductase
MCTLVCIVIVVIIIIIDDFAIVERVKEVAARLKVSCAQVALSWVLHRPGVTAPIIGVTKMPQLEEAVDALKIKLTAEDMTHIEETYKPHRILGHFS